MPIAGFLGRAAASVAGVPRVAYTCHGFLFNQPGPWPRRAASLAMEWLGGRMTDVFMTVSEEEAADARRLGIARARGRGLERTRPGVYRPDPEARARIRAALGVPEDRVVVTVVSRLVRHKGHPELVAAMRDVPGAELWVVGDRLTTDRGAGYRSRHSHNSGLGGRLRMLGYRDGRSRRARRLRHFRPAEPFRGPADVGDRGDADRAAGGRNGHPRPARAGGRRRDRAAGPAHDGRARWRGAAPPRRRPGAADANGRGRPRAGDRSLRRERGWSGGRWTCSDSRSMPRGANRTGNIRHDRYRRRSAAR